MSKRNADAPPRRAVWLCLLAAVLPGSLCAAGSPRPVEFNRDVRPILSDACYPCHGPDKAKRRAGVRLDLEEGAFADLGGGRKAIVPGDPAASELIRRVTSDDPDRRMPLASSGRKLSDDEIAVLRRWVEQGAKWQKHWAFLPPQRSPPPDVKQKDWPRNPIDAFVLARLEQEGLQPSPEADKTTLIRRVTLDLTGLPPTPAEVDAFLADDAPGAYEKVVDRLLASPRYGERMAARWLDAARYADTNGYQSDGERFMWRWRDWVIDAYNRDLPFDQFTVEQLAGDLLPNPTLDQRIATGFNRNHRGNAEGGVIPEEYAVEYVVDRVETTSTVWLGLTMGCARCHDHKFDPIKQKEFYQAFAFFNNVPENGRAVKFGNSPPLIPAPTAAQQQELKDLDKRLQDAEAEYARQAPDRAAARAAWEQALDRTRPLPWTPTEHLAARFPLDGDAGPATFKDGDAAYTAGTTGKAADLDGKRYLDAGDVGHFDYEDKFSIGAWVYPNGREGGAILSRGPETPQAEGYSLRLENGKLQLNLVKRWLDDALRVETADALAPDQWHHVFAVYDGSRTATGIALYIDGKPQKITVLLDELNQTFKSAEPLRIGSGGGPESRFHGRIADVRVYDDRLPAETVELIAEAGAIDEIAAIPPEKRTPPQAHKIEAYFLENAVPDAIRAGRRRLLTLRKEKDRLVESFPTTMVMEERPTPRDTFVLQRGQYDRPGEKVSPGVPASLPPLPSSAPNNRLGFARWLVDPGNPLTARVAVNRMWQMLFGVGLVKTTEDFGAQGEWPSYPDLLDRLATEFVRTGWDQKAMLKTIVLSATYRQSSKATKERIYRDPENRLLGRGPRFRLPAGTVRDQALAASGLLVEKVGGPSVRPYQPAGLWKELTGGADYVQDHGENLYRRSLYTFWKRTAPPPMMANFDAAGREACCVRETRTDTPLQALTLLNDVTFVEAARVLAQRAMKEGGPTPEGRVALMFRLATARPPKPGELKLLLDDLDRQSADFRKDSAAARKLTEVGEASRDESLDVRELAAYASVAQLILNLDETITKE